MDNTSQRLLYLQKSMKRKDELEQLQKKNERLYNKKKIEIQIFEKTLRKEEKM